MAEYFLKTEQLGLCLTPKSPEGDFGFSKSDNGFHTSGTCARAVPPLGGQGVARKMHFFDFIRIVLYLEYTIGS